MLKKLNKKKYVLLGVTGHLSTGKSTVSAMFAALGAGVVNADLLAHRALRPKGGCYKKVLSVFGKDILDKQQINRTKLARLVFADAVKLQKLEKIIHPVVAQETRKEVLLFAKAGKKIIVLDVPLLFESGMDQLVDATIVVKTNKKIQMSRTLAAGQLSSQEARARMRFQWPLAQKLRRADIIIDNGGTLKETQKQVKGIWTMIARRYLI